jgi:hypothetical protein
MTMFRRLLNATVMNSMIIFMKNSSQTKSDHSKFGVDLVQALLVRHGKGVERKVSGRHSTDETVPHLIERHFPERIPPTEKKAKPTKRCVVCCKQGKRRETVFWCPDCEAGLCVEGCFTAPSSTFKVKSITFFKSLEFMKYFVESFIRIQQFLRKLYIFQQCLALSSSDLNTQVENPPTAQY